MLSGRVVTLGDLPMQRLAQFQAGDVCGLDATQSRLAMQTWAKGTGTEIDILRTSGGVPGRSFSSRDRVFVRCHVEALNLFFHGRSFQEMIHMGSEGFPYKSLSVLQAAKHNTN